jgi:drug/metabolite transporter (DMT)-like permease
MNPHQRSLLELNLAVLLWGGTALFAKWIALPPFQITALRSVVATAALYAVLRWQGIPVRTAGWREYGWLFAGGVAMAAHWVTYFQAIQVSTVAVGILALHTYPVITAVVEPLVFRERVRGADLALALAVLGGVAVLVPEFSWASNTTRGVLLGVVSALCFAGRNLLTRGPVRIHGGTKVTFHQLAAGALVLLPVACVFGERVTVWSGSQLVLLGVLFTALPHTWYTRSLAHLKARSAGVIATLLPVYGALAAALFLGEIPTFRTLLGGAIILGAVTVETWRVMTAGSPPPDAGTTPVGPAAKPS